jgi:hypothetical protein
MDSAVPQDSRFLSGLSFAPDVDARLRTTLKRGTRDKDLRVLRESTNQLVQVLQMVLIRVVGIEPGFTGKLIRLVLA